MKNSPTRLIRLLVVIVLFAVMLFHAVPRVSAAPVIVDDFNVLTDALVLGVTSSNSPQYGFTADASILGGERDVEGTVAFGTGTMTVNASDVSGFYSHSQPAFLAGQSIITWDGADNNAAVNYTGLGGRDLTDAGNNDAFILGLISNDLATQVEVRVYSDAANWSFQTASIPAGSFEVAYPFLISGFGIGGGTGADFASVGAIQLIINSAATPVIELDIVIDFFTATSLTGYLDYGDAPNTYITTSGSNGPRHAMSSLVLGSLSDGEADGLASVDALEDDMTTSDDEDGVITSGLPWANGTNGGQVQVTVTGASRACLSGWMDFNQDGSFQAAEQIFTGRPVVAGVNNLSFTIPSGTFGTGSDVILNARFRIVPDVLANGACNSPYELPSGTGSWVNGEVEDYQWGFTTTAIELATLKAQSATSPAVPLALIGVSTVVLLSVVFLTRRGRRRTA